MAAIFATRTMTNSRPTLAALRTPTGKYFLLGKNASFFAFVFVGVVELIK